MVAKSLISYIWSIKKIVKDKLLFVLIKIDKPNARLNHSIWRRGGRAIKYG